ncbi:hypothetical protein [Rickettsia endosymbiont of Cantharis rufa]|uniref:hypothetical protein n=1 Tax=Rickettsia endosymbiont of Cantharis rufa TaxID=3066248 RepID=UPI003132B216
MQQKAKNLYKLLKELNLIKPPIEEADTVIEGRTSILQMWILKSYTFNKSSDDFIMNIQ